MVLSPDAAEDDWFAGRPGLRLREAPGPGCVTLQPVSSDSSSRSPGEIALACAGPPEFAAIERARAGGARVLWLATGRELATPGLLEAWLEVGLDGLHLWLHAATGAAHDFHAGAPGRFAAAAAAIGRARAAGVVVAVSSSLTRSSAPVLAGLPEWLRHRGVAAWRIAAIESERPLLPGAGVGPHDGLVPSLAAALPHALQAMARAGRLGLPAFISGAPLCLLGPFAGAALPGPGRAFAAACEGCPARAGCRGVAADQLERLGAAALQPGNLRPATAVAGPRWMFVGTGLIEQVETDMAEVTGPKRQARRLPVLAGEDG